MTLMLWWWIWNAASTMLREADVDADIHGILHAGGVNQEAGHTPLWSTVADATTPQIAACSR